MLVRLGGGHTMALTTMVPITTGAGAIGTARPTMTARALGSPATTERRPPMGRTITAPITMLPRVATITAATTGRAGLDRGRIIGLNPILDLGFFVRVGESVGSVPFIQLRSPFLFFLGQLRIPRLPTSV